MKTKLLLSLLLSFSFYLLSSQVPQGFNYQAIARSSNGKEIVNTSLQVKISVLSDTAGFYASGTGTYIWEEQQNVTTNSFGLFTLVLGGATATKVQGSAATFSAINWNSPSLYIGTKVNYLGVWRNLGTSKLGSVPYSLVSGSISGSVTKLAVKGNVASPDSALFEVKNNNGQTVFAVYNEGIRAYVDNGIVKGATKGGFAIGGFGTAKAASQPLMMISPDSARIYVDETAAKTTKGGFAIGGFNTAKGTTDNFMKLTPLNYFIGHKSGEKISSGLYNATLGFEAGKSLTSASNNVFIGYQSGLSTIGGSSTTEFGNSNIFIGTQAGYSNTTGNYNLALGRQAGFKNTTGWRNIFLGDWTAYYNTTGYQNVMIGDWAGYNNETGYQNLFLGAEAGWSNTEGNWNTLLGYLAGRTTATVGSQVLLGFKAGRLNTGGWNTMIGSLAGDSSGIGMYNTYVGLAAGMYAHGNNNVFLGRWAGRYEYTTSNKLIIESIYGSESSTDYYNNALIYGDFSSKYLRVNGQLLNSVNKSSGYAADFKNSGGLTGNYGVNVTAGTTAGTGTNYMIDFNNGGGSWRGSVVLTNNVVSLYQVSDARLKENIIQSGINAIQILKDIPVVDYDFIKSPNVTHTGYIAQDVQKVLPEMVIYNEKADAFAISTATLIPILHKALLDQQKEIEDLKALVNTLLQSQAKSSTVK